MFFHYENILHLSHLERERAWYVTVTGVKSRMSLASTSSCCYIPDLMIAI